MPSVSTFCRVLSLACTLALGASAQPGAEPPGESLRFHSYGTEHGLPSAKVSAVAQDALGFVWLATRDGAARFDGVRFQVWGEGAGGLPSGIVHDLHLDRGGTLWAATNRGVARWVARRGAFETVEALQDETVHALASDAGGLWASTRRGAVRVRPDGTAAPRPVTQTPFPVFGQARSDVWDFGGGCRLDAGRCVRPGGLPPGKAFQLRAVWSDDNGQTLGLTASGDVWAIAPRPRCVAQWTGYGDTDARGAALVADGRVWTPTADGIALYHDGATVRLGPAHGLAGRDAGTPFQDRQGGIWIPTDRGVSRWTPPRRGFRAVTVADGLPDGRVNGFATTADGSLWIATNGGLVRRRNGRFRLFFGGQGIAESAVWQVTPARGGGLWLGGKVFGLRRFWPETGRVVSEPAPWRLLRAPENDLPVRHIRDAPDGRLWISTSHGLAVRSRSGAWRAFHKGDGGLPSAAVNVTHADAAGRVWVGTDRGLVRMDGAAQFEPVEALRGVVVWHVADDPARPGALWVATVGRGACHVQPARPARVWCLTAGQGMPSNVVHRIEVGGGAVWFGTDRGLARRDDATGRIHIFTAADGLYGNVVDLMSSHRAADGTVIVGGPGGYTAVDAHSVRASADRPPVRISSLTAGGREVRGRAVAGVRLPRSARRFSVTFAALDFTEPALNRYRYRLRPVETAWTETDGRAAEARYAALPPGAYTFEVQGSNHAGAFSPHVARLGVRVPPAWWERRSVRGLFGLLALGAVAAAGWAAVRRGERRQAEAAEVARRLSTGREAERMRIARDLHDGAMQHLYRVGHDLDRLAAETRDPAGVRTARATLGEAADELRGVLMDIRPPHVGTLGAAAAVRAVAQRFGASHPETQVHLSLDATGRGWPVEVQHAAVRIVQEALSNAGRHARAARVSVGLAEADGQAVVTVEDDGRGFDATQTEVARVRAAHYGLAGMRERAEALCGRLSVASTPAGTQVRAVLPLH